MRGAIKMIKVKLRDDVREYNKGISVYEIAKDISDGLARAACAGIINGQTVDLRHTIEEDVELTIATFDSEQGKKAFRHTTAHILAQAVKRLFPNVKCAIGPAIEDGFYYDFDTEKAFTMDDLAKIEAEMKKIVKEELAIEKFELSRKEAIELMEKLGEPYKVELIQDLPEDAVLSFYKQGEFTDLCAGPHLMNTKYIKAFKLTSAAGAYWRGDSTKKMLCRVYGTAFTKKADLDEHIERIEEAKKRDHNKIGRELEFFTTVDVIGQGLPIMMPKGAKVIQILQRFVEDEEERRGYLLTKTPLMAKSDLYKISGHWDHYKEGMFVLGDEEKGEEVLALRPMTCPFQYQVYLNKQRSYRDLPLRYGETSTLFRNEDSGEMHGLIRVRQFTISEGHLVCAPEQVEDEFKGVLDLANYMMYTLGIEKEVTYRFSKWDPNNKEKYIDNPEAWERTENQMRKILDHLGVNYTEAADEAAFYGPKLDIQFKNVHGKEDTLITIQIDFALAERFGMTYIDSNGEKKMPTIIHRTSLGCYERTLAILIEKYAGALPTWMAPIQVKVLPISEKYHDYTQKVVDQLKAAGIRVQADYRSEKIGYKIREAQMDKVPYMLVVGEKEEQDQAVAVRSRVEGDKGSMALNEFLLKIINEVATRENYLRNAEENK
jgi:threonyl-tRNA synthetase